MEDDILHAKEEQDRQEGLDNAPPRRPDRLAPVHRMQVPAEAVGDLLAVWDFLKVHAYVVLFFGRLLKRSWGQCKVHVAKVCDDIFT